MIRVLITGVSGVGKTAVIGALRARGLRAIDMDEQGWAFIDEHGHQRWHLARLLPILEDRSADLLFVSGCSEDQATLYPKFSKIILLSAPRSLIVQRLASRTPSQYGKDRAELAEVLKSLDEIEPLLRRRATHEIITTQSLDQVVCQVLEIARQ